ncbi:MAG: superoxide dismutase family protein [Oceanicaulis sp.]
MNRLALLSTAAVLGAVIALPACAESATQEADAQPETMQDMDHGADTGEAGEAVSGAAEATATLINRDRDEVGTVRFVQGPEGVVLTIEADVPGLSSGQWHGAHLHKIGDCSNEDFTSSGGHINVDGSAHGYLNPEGPDNADLPNLWVHSDGALRAQAYTENVSIGGQTGAPALLDADGSAFVMHANPDDMISQPIGGAGARVLCGVIEAAD